MSYDQHPPPHGWHRMLDGQFGFAINDPSRDRGSYLGYWMWRNCLYRNGELYGDVKRYWFDREKLGWWIDYRRI